MFKKFGRWFGNLSIWDWASNHVGCVAIFLILGAGLVGWSLTVVFFRLVLGLINSVFALPFTNNQLWVGALVWCIISSIFGAGRVIVIKQEAARSAAKTMIGSSPKQ
jgi:hypothetical protein